jgi:hypothetical protein
MKTKKKRPSTNGAIGERDERGRFTLGNAGGPGNPFSAAVSRLRSALLSAVTERDIEEIIGKLIKQAKAGNIMACREVLDRCIGKPIEMDFLERLESLEKILLEIGK